MSKYFCVCSKGIEKIKQQDGNVSSIKKFYSFLINYYTNVFSSLSGTFGSNKKKASTSTHEYHHLMFTLNFRTSQTLLFDNFPFTKIKYDTFNF